MKTTWMELVIPVSRNRRPGITIGRLSADYVSKFTILDLAVLRMDLGDIKDFATLVFQDDEWGAHFGEAEEVWNWQVTNGMTRNDRYEAGWVGPTARIRDGSLVEAVASLFPDSWLPIGLALEDRDVWSGNGESS